MDALTSCIGGGGGGAPQPPLPLPGFQKQHIHAAAGGWALLLIDPQVDFHPGGSLAIPTANADSDRLAALVAAHAAQISQITVTLDTHQRLHIANPQFWRSGTGDGAPPAPFTIIEAADLEAGTWKTARAEHAEWALSYARALDAGGRFKICVWPEHCLIGTPGHAVVPQINEARAVASRARPVRSEKNRAGVETPPR